ncbi:unnamed protein product [Prunus armeniaca]|uniref:Uncharacterized protein n=1 Tax=Prunus armeniaca TaxID=36596 RepID=A0A6J5VS64_PRUAR|nr:unnamed protein product [Prunus armeniaca]
MISPSPLLVSWIWKLRFLRDWNPKRFLVRSEEPDYADRVRENRRMKRMASRSHLKRTTSPPSWMPILRSSPGASGFHASRCYQGIDKYHVGARISVGCSANGGVEGRPPDSHSAGGWSRSCNRDSEWAQGRPLLRAPSIQIYSERLILMSQVMHKDLGLTRFPTMNWMLIAM